MWIPTGIIVRMKKTKVTILWNNTMLLLLFTKILLEDALFPKCCPLYVKRHAQYGGNNLWKIWTEFISVEFHICLSFCTEKYYLEHLKTEKQLSVALQKIQTQSYHFPYIASAKSAMTIPCQHIISLIAHKVSSKSRLMDAFWMKQNSVHVVLSVGPLIKSTAKTTKNVQCMS